MDSQYVPCIFFLIYMICFVWIFFFLRLYLNVAQIRLKLLGSDNPLLQVPE